MKKTLIAAAVAATFVAAPAAFAETTLYGQGHVSLDSATADGVDDHDLVLASNSSRIGVKGSYELSSALSAVYQMEWGVGVDGEGASMSNRNRFVGLKGGFGTVVFGQHDTPMKLLGNKYELSMGGTQFASATPLIASGNFHLRLPNVIGYINSFGPVNLFAAYSTGVAGDDTNAATGFSATIGYGDGKPFSVDVGYELHDEEVYGNGEDATAARIGAAYTIGAVKLMAQFTQETAVRGNDGADRTVAGLGAALTMGKNVLKAQYYMADVDADDSNSEVMTLGLDHKLNKQATIYASYAAATNDAQAAIGLGGSGHDTGAKYTPSLGGDADGFSLGLIVNF